jgi:quinoprotein glucose dehydrogenase
MTALMSRRTRAVWLGLGFLAVAAIEVRTQGNGTGDWRYFLGDAAGTKYSPLAQITRENVKDLRVVWRRPSVDASLTGAFPDLKPSNNLRATPILIDGVLYASNGVGLVEAFDPATGKTIWIQEPFERGMKGVAGQSTRAVAYWRSGSEERLFLTRGEYLEALHPKTGKYVSRSTEANQGGHTDRQAAMGVRVRSGDR